MCAKSGTRDARGGRGRELGGKLLELLHQLGVVGTRTVLTSFKSTGYSKRIGYGPGCRIARSTFNPKGVSIAHLPMFTLRARWHRICEHRRYAIG